MSPLSSRRAGSLAFMVRALRYRNYRLFFGGQIVSLTGTWMTNVAMSWLVYRLTGSAALLGLVGFAGQFPAFLLSPVAGIYADRWDQRRLLVATQTLSMLQSFTLAWLTLSGRINVPLLVALSAANGMINAFDMPARQVFVASVIERRQDLGNAIAMNSTMFNAARLLGPSVGGMVIAAWGEGWCFLIDGASFLAVIGALLAMRLKTRPPRARAEGGMAAHLREGWSHAFGFMPIRSIILLLALVGLVGVPYMVLVPIFAGRILHGGPSTLGLLMASSGCGALIGAGWLASRRSVRVLSRAVPVAAAGFGAGLVAFSFSRSVPLSCVLMVAAGFAFLVQMASSNTILQTIVDDDKRGRVMSFFMMAFLGTAPFGSLLAGALADRIGAPRTLFIGGLGCLAGAAWFSSLLPELEKAVRPIYDRLGIEAEVEAGVEAASELILPPERENP